MVNMSPETGIRYGIISANALDPEIVNEIQQRGKDVHYDEARSDVEADVFAACNKYMGDWASQYVADKALERFAEQWTDDEPVHEFDLEGVKGRTTWLGGALMVWVFDSPHTGTFQLCSPCVPGGCDLDSPAKSGAIGYDVPTDWRYTNE